MSGHSIQNSMTNKKGGTIIKIRGILLCSYSYAKSILLPSHAREYEYKPGNFFFMLYICGICVRFYV